MGIFSNSDKKLHIKNRLNCLEIEVEDTDQIFLGLLIYLKVYTDIRTQIYNPVFDWKETPYCLPQA